MQCATRLGFFHKSFRPTTISMPSPCFIAPSPRLVSSLRGTPLSKSSTNAPRRPHAHTTTAVLQRRSSKRRAENARGNLYVDTTCIDCDTCRWVAPNVFHAINGMSAVHTQPTTRDEELVALQAMQACPTGSIRTESPSARIKEAQTSFPLPAKTWDGQLVPHVFYNGFTSSKTFACSSWLVLDSKAKQPCNVMFDCPRFFEPLARQIDDLTAATGGVQYIVLSHRDDVANHDRWAARLGAKRIIHEKECNRSQGTDACEMKLKDEQFPYQLASGLQILHVPGHSIGSIALLHHDSQSLFSGDHLAWSQRRGSFGGFPDYLSHSWRVQIESVAKLEDVPFLHVWPGHGRSFHVKDAQERKREIRKAVEAMKGQRSRLP